MKMWYQDYIKDQRGFFRLLVIDRLSDIIDMYTECIYVLLLQSLLMRQTLVDKLTSHRDCVSCVTHIHNHTWSKLNTQYIILSMYRYTVQRMYLWFMSLYIYDVLKWSLWMDMILWVFYRKCNHLSRIKVFPHLQFEGCFGN